MTAADTSIEHVDVVICGGGIAGLCAARQLLMHSAHRDRLTIALIEQKARPLPSYGYKVGESSFEMGSWYLLEHLQLGEYLEANHVQKLGLRFFFPPAGDAFDTRPELGLSRFPDTFQTYQVDRSILESDLRADVEESRVHFFEGWKIERVEVNPGETPHRISFARKDSGEQRTLTARWLIDATGRRVLMQKMRRARVPSEDIRSAAWMQYQGWIEPEEWVARDNEAWLDRVPERRRAYSTQHLMGPGYWVWLIPLANDVVSVGIVASEKHHPYETFGGQEKAQRWLEVHEPELAATLRSRELLSFRKMRNYCYSSNEMVSKDRWISVGEAATFADPLLSAGLDLIGLSNLMAGHLIDQDLSGRHSSRTVARMNAIYLSYNDGLTRNLQSLYSYFDEAAVSCCSLIWTFMLGWGLGGPLIFDRVFADPAHFSAFGKLTGPLTLLQRRMERLFDEWHQKTRRRWRFEFVDYLAIPFVKELRSRHVLCADSPEQMLRSMEKSVGELEAFAQCLFRLAVEDCLPEHAPRLQDRWLNAWAVGLDPERWEDDGLFTPRTQPIPWQDIDRQLRAVFTADASPPR